MYTDHYGLTAPPFALTPDARFWFESATHKKAMAYLGYGLAQGEGFVTITGDIGAGKSTLVAHLLEQIDPARVLAGRIASTQVAGDDMLRLVSQAFGLPADGADKAQTLDRIERFLGEQGRAGRKVLLIVDEAQNLPISALEELRMLSNFQSGGKALLQVLLLGQPEFRDRLAASSDLEQLRQRVIATHHLDPMSAAETRPYLEHRLGRAGWVGNPAFDDEACALLHAASGGVPRRLNTLATRALLMGALDGSTTIDAHIARRVAADLDGERPAASAPAPVSADGLLDHAARIAMLESQMHEQEAALRRVLTLLVDWIEREDAQAPRARAG